MEKKSVACQTQDRAIKTLQQLKSKKMNFGTILVCAFCCYVLLCGVCAMSSYAQAALIYLHPIRFPFGDLKDHQRFGLLNARNIDIITGM